MSNSQNFSLDTVTMFVANGRTVQLDGVSHGPGAEVTLPHEEANALAKLGFLVPSPPPIRQATIMNPAGIGLQLGAQGPNYTP